PTGNLDSKNGDAILDLLLDLHRERRMTLVMVTHSEEIAAMAERVLILHDGRLVEDVRQHVHA
ncbi:MAG: ABC transporter ATP-binding protein, partial [Caldilineaceae bacterium]|nr:ABC transporter ATP-binding protein [Caldilineaceae bacterium]